MKKILATAIMIASAASAAADGYEWLNIRQSDGSELSLTAEGLKIVYSGGNLVATDADGQTTTVALTNLSAMYFSNTAATGISSLSGQPTEVSVADGRIYVTGSEGTNVTVAGMSGMLLGNHTLTSGSAEAVTGQLPKGVYIVKINKSTVKVCVE